MLHGRLVGVVRGEWRENRPLVFPKFVDIIDRDLLALGNPMPMAKNRCGTGCTEHATAIVVEVKREQRALVGTRSATTKDNSFDSSRILRCASTLSYTVC